MKVVCRSSVIDLHNSRAGLSLLEVLVACGILAIGLTSVAALLPAASSRFGQAAQADRGGVLAANAYAEVMTRGLVAADMFSVPTRACVFGNGLGSVPTVAATVAAAASSELGIRMSGTNGFLFDDDLVYATGTASALPVNTFESATSPLRRFNQGLCWGAMISGSVNAAPGAAATLSIAVFKKAPAVRALTLTGTAGATMLRFVTGTATGLVDEATTKRFMPPCAYVLAVTSPPQWLKVDSSWTLSGTMVSGKEDARSRRSFVVLDSNPMTSGTTLSVVGFDQLLRVDRYSVTLE
jgi:hypothetical protein